MRFAQLCLLKERIKLFLIQSRLYACGVYKVIQILRSEVEESY